MSEKIKIENGVVYLTECETQPLFQLLMEDHKTVKLNWNNGISINTFRFELHLDHEPAARKYYPIMLPGMRVQIMEQFSISDIIKTVLQIDIPFTVLMVKVFTECDEKSHFIPLIIAADELLEHVAIDKISYVPREWDMEPFDSYTINEFCFTPEVDDTYFCMMEAFNAFSKM